MSSLTGPVLAEYQDLFTSTTTQGGPHGGLKLGAKAYTGDGREFRFSLAGATAYVPGKLYQAPAQTTAWEAVAVAAAAVGATSVTLTASLTLAKNVLAGGYLIIATTPGQGYQYEISGNTAVTSAANCVVYLVDPIQVAITTSSTVTVIANPYSGCILVPTTPTGMSAGVAVYPVTAAQYGWLQVAGTASVLAAGAITIGTALVPSGSITGAVTPLANAATLMVVGVAMQGIADTDYGAVWLNIG